MGLAVCVALCAGLVVRLQAGTLSAVAPSGASPTVTIQLTGSGFDSTPASNEVTFRTSAGETAVATPTAVAVVDAARGLRRLTLRVPTGLSVGRADLTVLNRATGEVSTGLWLEVVALALPELTSGAPGATNLRVRITGSANAKFAAGSRAVLGTGITVVSTTVESPTSVVATISIAAGAAVGPRSVTVITTTQTVTLTDGFLVSATPPPPPVNAAPVVSAGPDQSVTLPSGATLNGSVTDDGLPAPGAITSGWAQLSGAGVATFGPPNAAATTVTFSAAGSYVLQLTAGDGALSASDDVAVTVSPAVPPANRAPTANAGGPYVITAGQPLTFNGSGLDLDGDALTYAWTFGDGGTGTGASAVHTYATAGPFTATLTVDDGRTGTASATAGVTVNVVGPPANRPPTANAGGPYSGAVGQPVVLSAAASSDPDPADTLTYGWTFGDGARGSGVSPAHAYAGAGPFTVTLTVSDSHTTAMATASVTITQPAAGNLDPTANAGGPYAGTVSQPVSVAATGADPDGDSLQFLWEFGDGQTAAGASAAHAYATAGQYIVRVTASDGRGGSATASSSATISGLGNRAPAFSSTPALTAAHQRPYSYQATASDADGDALAFSVGESPIGLAIDRTTGLVSWTPTGNQLGAQAVTLIVTDSHGASSTQSFDITVSDITAPVVSLSLPSEALPGATVTATALATDNVAVVGVGFEVNGTDATDQLNEPFQRAVVVPATAIAGTEYHVRATARDAAGNTALADRVFRVAATPDTQPPTVTLNVAPQASPGTTVQVSAAAADNVGVKSVVFRVDGALLSTDPDAPYLTSFGVPAGAAVGSSIAFTARAIDFSDNFADTTGSLLVVATPDVTPPTVQLLAPPSAQEGASITVSATAADNVGVSSVTFFVNGVNVGVATTSPYSTPFRLPADVAGGDVLNVEARALDFSSLTASSFGSIDVIAAPNRPPTANAGGPYSGQVGDLIRLTAAASSDPDAGARLTFDWNFGDGTSGSGVSPGRAYAAPGTFTVVVTVSDGRGGVSTSDATVIVSVATDRRPPSITLNGPTEALPGAQVTMTAQVADDRGVVGVSFAINGGAPADVTGPPYQRPIDVPSVASPGDRILVRATARDAAGNEASAERAVTIAAVPDTENPVVVLHAPPVAAGGTTIRLSATATDNVGVQSLSFTVNGAIVATLAGPPFETDYPVPANAPNGSSIGVVVRASDFNGNHGEASGAVGVVLLSDADTTPPSVSLAAPLQVFAGRTVLLTAQAQDNVGLASVRLVVDGATVATFTGPPFSFTYPLGASQSAGTILSLRADATDLSGLTASATGQTLIVSPASAGQGVLTGEVYDDTTGLAVGGATVQLTGTDATGAPYAGTTLSDARGRWVLRATEGDGIVRISRAGWTGVDRRAHVVVNQAVEVFDARVTPVSALATSVSAVLGGTVLAPTGTTARLQVLPGALQTATSLTLTPLSQQGLAGLLPAGWSPVAMADVGPHGVAFGTSASLSLPNTFAVGNGVTLVTARWDEEASAWRAVGAVVSPVSGPLVLEVPQTGQFALLRPDALPLAPSLPAAGDLLDGIALSPLALNASALVDPQPRILFYRPGVHSDVHGTITTALAISSGLPIEARIVESYAFLAGTNVRPDPFVEDVVFYQVGAASTGLAAGFVVTPSQVFDPLALQLGVITVELQAPPLGPRLLATVGPDGGSAGTAGADTLQVPQGALTEPLPVSVRALTASTLGITLPPGVSVAGGALVTFSGTLARSATLSLTKPAAVGAATPLLLVRAQEVGGETRLVLVGRGVVAGSQMVSDTTLNGAEAFEGIRVAGRYFFVTPTDPFGFARGLVRGTTGGPFAGAVVSAANFPIVSLSQASGGYVGAALVGVVTLTAVDLINADAGAGTGTLASAGAVLPIDLQLGLSVPRVTSVSPVDGATNIALSDPIVVRFSKAIAPASVNGANAGNVRLALADGTVVSAAISLSGGNLAATLRPSVALLPNTVYTVVVADGVTDVAGRHLVAAVTSQFRSLDTAPPPMPAAGSITASIPGTDGFTTVAATQGTAATHDTVTVVNLTRHTTTPVLLDPNGGFIVRVATRLTDKLQITITDQHGNQTVVAVPQFRQSNADGSISTVVTAEGGHVDGPGGVAVDVPAGAFPEGTVVTLKPVTEAQFPVQLTQEQRQVFQYTGGISIDLGGKTPTSYLNVSIATTGGETLEDQWIVGQATYLNGHVFLDAADTARVIDGRVRTSSPPCPGVTGSGVYGFLKSARPLGVTYASIPNPNSGLLATAMAWSGLSTEMPVTAGGAMAMAEAVGAEFLNPARQVCMPILSGRTTVVPNKVRLEIPVAQIQPEDAEIVVKNLSTSKVEHVYLPFNGRVSVDGSETDPFSVEALDYLGTGHRPLTFTVTPRSFVRVDVGASVFTALDTQIQIRNVNRNVTWNSGLTGSTTRPLGHLSAIVEGSMTDTLVTEVTDNTGAVRTVAASAQPYALGSGNLLLRTAPGTIDPTQAEINAYNATVPAVQQIRGSPVIQVSLLRYIQGPAGIWTLFGSGEVILDTAAGDTARVATGALTYPFSGSLKDRFSLHVTYGDGRVDIVNIPTFQITVRSGIAGSVVKEIVGQVPPRGEPMHIDLGTNGAPATLATEPDGFFHVEVQTPFTLSFSRGLDAQSVRDHMKLMVVDASGSPIVVPGTWALIDRNRTVTFVPFGPLQMGKTYQVVMNGVTAGGQPLSVTSLPIKTFSPVKLSSLALPEPHLALGSVVNASVASALAIGDVEILRQQIASGIVDTTVVASTTNQQGSKYHDIDVNNPRAPAEVGHTAGGMPRRLRLVTGIRPPAVDVTYDVPLLGQQTGMSCWAASAAMIVAFRDQVSINPFDVATAGDPTHSSLTANYWDAYGDGISFSATNLAKLASVWGLALEPPQNFTVQGLKTMLEQYGPLWVGGAAGIGAHVRVITGIHGDGTPAGTSVVINDPWDVGKEGFSLPNSGSQYEEPFTEFVVKQEVLSRRLFGDPAGVIALCTDQGLVQACQAMFNDSLMAKLQACFEGNQTVCEDPQLNVVGSGATIVAHLATLPPSATPSGAADAGLPLFGGAGNLPGTGAAAIERIALLGNCATNVSIGTTGQAVFMGDLLVAPLYSSFGSSVNFFDVTDRANPCLLGGRPLTRNPESLPPPGGADYSPRGTVKQYGFARGVAVLPTTTGIEAYIALAELGLMPVSVGDNIPDVSPFVRTLGPVYPGDFVDVAVVGERLLLLNNNFGGMPSLEALDGNLSPLGSVAFDATRSDPASPSGPAAS